MDHRALVIAAAKALGALNGDGELVRLDSLTMVDLVIALEDASGVEIPEENLTESVFASINSIAAMLSTLTSKGPPNAG